MSSENTNKQIPFNLKVGQKLTVNFKTGQFPSSKVSERVEKVEATVESIGDPARMVLLNMGDRPLKGMLHNKSEVTTENGELLGWASTSSERRVTLFLERPERTFEDLLEEEENEDVDKGDNIEPRVASAYANALRSLEAQKFSRLANFKVVGKSKDPILGFRIMRASDRRDIRVRVENNVFVIESSHRPNAAPSSQDAEPSCRAPVSSGHPC